MSTEKGQDNLAQYVNKMIKDVKASHRGREDQLSQAAQGYKNRLESVVRRHEELLCAYRDLRSQVEALGLSDLDLGPDERELIVSDSDLQSAQQKEILKLQAELHSLRINMKQVSKFISLGLKLFYLFQCSTVSLASKCTWCYVTSVTMPGSSKAICWLVRFSTLAPSVKPSHI